MDTKLIEQKKHVTDIVHYLLDGLEEENWQINGNFPTRKLLIEIPEAFAYLTLYREKLAQNPGHPVKKWTQLEKSFFDACLDDDVYRSIQHDIRTHLNTMLWEEGHYTLHYFFHGHDWRLYTEEERQRRKDAEDPDEPENDQSRFGKWDNDDNLPF